MSSPTLIHACGGSSDFGSRMWITGSALRASMIWSNRRYPSHRTALAACMTSQVQSSSVFVYGEPSGLVTSPETSM
jgi:hypothetical protein